MKLILPLVMLFSASSVFAEPQSIEFACNCLGYEKGLNQRSEGEFAIVIVDGRLNSRGTYSGQHDAALIECKEIARKRNLVFTRVSCTPVD